MTLYFPSIFFLDTFRNDAFTTYLAAIGHNSHAFRKAAVSASGKLKYNKVYSKRSKNWRIVNIKELKTYDFWPTIATRILKKRIDSEESILRKVEVPDDHPKKIAPSIALKPIPKTSDLVRQHLTRFVSRTSESGPEQQADEWQSTSDTET